MFDKKLIFLMDLTNTKNKILADATEVDASFICRLRQGTRKLPNNQTFLLLLSNFFAQKIVSEYQIQTFCHFAGVSEQTYTKKNSANIISNWLLEKDTVHTPQPTNLYLCIQK